jgi:hypothetical protein
LLQPHLHRITTFPLTRIWGKNGLDIDLHSCSDHLQALPKDQSLVPNHHLHLTPLVRYSRVFRVLLSDPMDLGACTTKNVPSVSGFLSCTLQRGVSRRTSQRPVKCYVAVPMSRLCSSLIPVTSPSVVRNVAEGVLIQQSYRAIFDHVLLRKRGIPVIQTACFGQDF